MEPLALSINAAAKTLSIGRSTIYGLIKSHRLETIKIGTRTLVTTASLTQLAQSRKNT